MLEVFLVPTDHLLFDDTRISSIASSRKIFLAHFPKQCFIPYLNTWSSICIALWNSALQDLKQSVNDNWTGSSLMVAVDLNIKARMTKCASDNAYNSWIAPFGVSLRRWVGLVARSGSWCVFSSSKTSSCSQYLWYKRINSSAGNDLSSNKLVKSWCSSSYPTRIIRC